MHCIKSQIVLDAVLQLPSSFSCQLPIHYRHVKIIDFSKIVGILSIKYFGGYHQAGGRGWEGYRYLKSVRWDFRWNQCCIHLSQKETHGPFCSTSSWLTWACKLAVSCCVLVCDSGGSTVETLDSSRKGFWVSRQAGLRATVFFSSSDGQRCSERLFFTMTWLSEILDSAKRNTLI